MRLKKRVVKTPSTGSLILRGFASILLLFWTGCATEGNRSASGKEISVEAIQTANAMVERKQIPPELRPHFFALYAEGRQNSVLHAMRGGLATLRLQHRELAKEAFDQAIREVEALQFGQAQAERTAAIPEDETGAERHQPVDEPTPHRAGGLGQVAS